MLRLFREGNHIVTKILCPTRGGEASIPNQMLAIDIAKERAATVVFLHISDIHFLDHTASPVHVDVVQEQLEEMGEFLLVMAQERARESGVESEAEVRQGEFRQTLETVIREKEISVVVLGSGSQGTGITTPEYRQGLADTLAKTCGVEVIISAVGEIVQHVKPADSGLPGETTKDD